MAATNFFLPRSTDEAVALLDEHGDDLVVLGGGTIVMGLVNGGLLFPRRLMSLARARMDGIEQVNGGYSLGAAVTLAALARLDTVPLVAEAAALVGGPALRTTATIGGNLHAASSYGDLGVALLALDAQVELCGPNGRRTVPLAEFYRWRAEPSKELVTAIHIPQMQGRTAYIKQMRRQVNAPAVVSVAVRIATGEDGACTEARIALGAAGPYPLRAGRAEATLVGQVPDARVIGAAAEAAMAECDPPTDAQASAWYRRRMVGVQVRRALERALRAS